MNYKIIQGDCLTVLPDLPKVDCIFADPPDNIGLDYNEYVDRITNYPVWLASCLYAFTQQAKITWISYNSKHVFTVGRIVDQLLDEYKCIQAKSCVQTFTFGNYDPRDLSNNHRMLLRLKHVAAPLYPDSIRVESDRQKAGDKRADPRGRVPGDVFDFPRVTGNSHQRRKWHKTQLHEGLIERCIKMSTKEGGTVIDPFGGSGTTLRVCKRINRDCTIIELDSYYCSKIREENEITN